MLSQYYPGKYATDTRIEDVYKGAPEGYLPSVKWEGWPEFIANYYQHWNEYPPELQKNLLKTMPKFLGGYYKGPDPPEIHLPTRKAMARFPHSLDINRPFVERLLKHEGAHGIFQKRPESYKKAMGKLWSETEEEPEFLQRIAYMKDAEMGQEVFDRRTADEYLARLAAGQETTQDPRWLNRLAELQQMQFAR